MIPRHLRDLSRELICSIGGAVIAVAISVVATAIEIPTSFSRRLRKRSDLKEQIEPESAQFKCLRMLRDAAFAWHLTSLAELVRNLCRNQLRHSQRSSCGLGEIDRARL